MKLTLAIAAIAVAWLAMLANSPKLASVSVVLGAFVITV